MPATIDASITPKRSMEILSHREVELLKSSVGEKSVHALFRQCALAILCTGSTEDNAKTLLEIYKDFRIDIIQQDRGLRLNLTAAPADAFVDGEMITSTREMLFSALRDIVYSHVENEASNSQLNDGDELTDYVFHLLRKANALHPGKEPNLVVCWGGHSISSEEYNYCKDVGHELGLRYLNVCTGCGPGAMKGPMKGATIAHAKQRVEDARYIGLTEPGIIAAEAPNPIVNELVILPDIEKRLEAFVRLGHGIIVFPGGAGTSEEVLYLLGILLHPDNQSLPFPLVLTGPKSSEPYFSQLHEFIGLTLGFEAQQRYKIIIDDAAQAAQEMRAGFEKVKEFRRENNDAYHFNWSLTIDADFQQPFEPSHENMAALALKHDLPKHTLAANLRRAFSGIVAGNVKAEGINRIEAHGPYQLSGDEELMAPLDELLRAFVEQKRMKLPGTEYIPCYELN